MSHPTSRPVIGQIVQFALAADDVDQINRRRSGLSPAELEAGHHHAGTQVHVGNPAAVGHVFPAVIVAVWSDTCVNLQVFLDGNDVYWAKSKDQGAGEGQWS